MSSNMKHRPRDTAHQQFGSDSHLQHRYEHLISISRSLTRFEFGLPVHSEPPLSVSSDLQQENSIRAKQQWNKELWFNDAKGYGFVTRDSGGDVFVHFSAIQSGGFRSLQESQRVQFNVPQGPKRLQAENVQAA